MEDAATEAEEETAKEVEAIAENTGADDTTDEDEDEDEEEEEDDEEIDDEDKRNDESSDDDDDDDDDEDLENLGIEETVTTGAHDDFDWTITRTRGSVYPENEREKLQEQYDSTLSSVIENEIVKGRVTSISDGDVVLDINFKSDGLVPLSEFRDNPDLTVGDEVEVYV